MTSARTKKGTNCPAAKLRNAESKKPTVMRSSQEGAHSLICFSLSLYPSRWRGCTPCVLTFLCLAAFLGILPGNSQAFLISHGLFREQPFPQASVCDPGRCTSTDDPFPQLTPQKCAYQQFQGLSSACGAGRPHLFSA